MDVRRLLLASVIAIAFGGGASAAQFYVATNGNDSAAGTSAAPWKTLQRAANVVNPGDRVTVRAGNYAGFNLTRSGMAGAPIEFVAEPNVLINQPNPCERTTALIWRTLRMW